MIVGALEVELHLPGSSSLKDKRLVLRSLMDRLHNRFNVAVSEVEHHDVWQRAVLGIVTVSKDAAVANSVLSHVQDFVERDPRIVLVDVHLEMR